jgi:hypothetical protein
MEHGHHWDKGEMANPDGDKLQLDKLNLAQALCMPKIYFMCTTLG